MQHIGPAADLAIFDISLAPSGGFIHCRLVPLTATCALKAGLHRKNFESGELRFSHCTAVPDSAPDRSGNRHGLRLGNGRAPRETRLVGVADVPQILDANLAGEKAVRCHAAQEREELDALA